MSKMLITGGKFLVPLKDYLAHNEAEYGFHPNNVRAYKYKTQQITVVTKCESTDRNVWGRRYLQAAEAQNIDYVGVFSRDGELFGVTSISREDDSVADMNVVPLRKINGSWADALTHSFALIGGALGFNTIDNGMYTPCGPSRRLIIVKDKKKLLDGSLTSITNDTQIMEGL